MNTQILGFCKTTLGKEFQSCEQNRIKQMGYEER